MTESKKEITRFQDCPWYIRLWRYRWYFLIPWWTVRYKMTPWVEPDTGELAREEPWNTWKISYSIAIGTAQGKMNWYYTWEEVTARMNNTIKGVRDKNKKRKKKPSTSL